MELVRQRAEGADGWQGTLFQIHFESSTLKVGHTERWKGRGGGGDKGGERERERGKVNEEEQVEERKEMVRM